MPLAFCTMIITVALYGSAAVGANVTPNRAVAAWRQRRIAAIRHAARIASSAESLHQHRQCGARGAVGETQGQGQRQIEEDISQEPRPETSPRFAGAALHARQEEDRTELAIPISTWISDMEIPA
jgi:hypothetical protein